MRPGRKKKTTGMFSAGFQMVDIERTCGDDDNSQPEHPGRGKTIIQKRKAPTEQRQKRFSSRPSPHRLITSVVGFMGFPDPALFISHSGGAAFSFPMRTCLHLLLSAGALYKAFRMFELCSCVVGWKPDTISICIGLSMIDGVFFPFNGTHSHAYIYIP